MSRKSESMGRKSGGMGGKSEGMGRKSESMGGKSEGMGRKSEDMGRKNEDMDRRREDMSKKSKSMNESRKSSMKYSTEIIRNRYNSGEEMEFIFFWGHTAIPGVIRKSCFSQWYPCEFEVDGVKYYTTEQYMMAQKALLFGDQEVYEQIMAADGPHAYKKLGRKVRNFDSKTWDQEKTNIVLKGNIAKFSQNEELKEFILSTGEKVLVEASPYDKIWGINRKMDDPDITNPNSWGGENLLGFVLMETRDILAGE